MINKNKIESFISGTGPYDKLNYVRAVEANNYNNSAIVFIRDPKKNEVLEKTIKFTPFLFVKDIDFDLFFKEKTVLIDPDFIVNGSFIYDGITYKIKENDTLIGYEARYVDEDEWTGNHIYKCNIPNVSDRKKFYKEKLNQYNIKVKKLKVDNSVPRLVNGFKFLYEIKEKEYPNKMDNPLLMYNKSGKVKDIRPSFYSLQNFFKEGGMNVYDRKGFFLDHEQFINYFNNSSKKEQLKLYFSTLDILKKANLDLSDIFKLKVKEHQLLDWIKEKYDFKIRGVYGTYEDIIVKDKTVDLNKIDSDICVVNSDYEDAYKTLGEHHHCYLTCEDTEKWYFHTNVCLLLEGITNISSDWNIAKKVISKYIDYFLLNANLNKSVYILDQRYKHLFGKNYSLFVNYLSERIKEKTHEIKRTNNYSLAQLPNYIDIIGMDEFCENISKTDIFNIVIDPDYVKEIKFSFHKGYKGKKFVNILSYFDNKLTYEVEPYFQPLSATSQFMIQTGVRLFRGIEFDDLKILTLDIETRAQPLYVKKDKAALYPETGEVFQIGISCTDGMSKVLYADNNKEEKEAIIKTYEIIRDTNPDIVLTYNGEFFDFPFLEKRLEYLGCMAPDYEGEESSIQFICKLFAKEDEKYINKYYSKRQASLKVGGATERYFQTNSYGINFLDGMHCIKKLQAIDKRDSRGLKQNVILEKIVKEDRVYIKGNKIGEIGKDTRDYFFNTKDGSYFVNEIPIKTQQKIFLNSDIKLNSEGKQFYGSANNLYLISNNGVDDYLKKCENVIRYVNKPLASVKKELYQRIQNYDCLILPDRRFGLEHKGTNKFDEVVSFLKKLKVDFCNLEKVYKETFNFNDYIKVSGKYIVERYLLDDLWETLELFKKTGQSSFLLCGLIPIEAQKVYTMGYASMWKILLTGWHYQSNLAIPDYEPYRKINGGLIGMFESGYVEDVVKNDASSLYPSAKLAYLSPPDWDVLGFSDGILRHFLETRLLYKKLKNDFKAKGDYVKSKLYDILQGPLKIFINSYYGFLGAYDVSPFSSMFTAHGITAMSRSFAAHLIRYFETKGFRAIYVHTDGVNFHFPKHALDYTYVGKGINWLVERDKIYKGLQAYVAEYNDIFMEDKMGVDIDGIDVSCLNIAKSNVVHYKYDPKRGNSIEYVGGLIKKDTPNYIKFFIEKNVETLMKGNGKDFLISYFNYIKKIVDGKLKAIDIASKVKFKGLETYEATHKTKSAPYELVKAKNLKVQEGDIFYFVNTGKGIKTPDFTTIKKDLGYFDITEKSDVYINEIIEVLDGNERLLIKEYILNKIDDDLFTLTKSKQKTLIKNLNEKDKTNQIKMGLFENDIIEKILPNYFMLDQINNWDKISYKITSKKTKKLGVQKILLLTCHKEELNVREVPSDDHESYVEYNVAKYLESFIKAVSPLFLAFNETVRKELYVDLDTEEYDLPLLSNDDFKLISGVPLQDKKDNQQDKDETMMFDPIEMKYWVEAKKSPFYFLDKKDFNKEEYIIKNKNKEYYVTLNNKGRIQMESFKEKIYA